MIIHIISIGKPAKGFDALIEKYLKKCNKYFKIKNNELKNIKIKNIETKKIEEEKSILKALGDGIICLLDETGKNYDTVKFAKFIKKHIQISKDIYFIIGGAYGVTENVKKRADYIIRLSDMTLQHDIALLMFYEQLYRAVTIIKRIPYHK